VRDRAAIFSGYGAGNRIQGSFNVFARRPGLHAAPPGTPKFNEFRALRRNLPENAGEGINIAAGKNKFAVHRQNQIARGSHGVAHSHWAAAAHGFVNDDRKGLVLGRQNHEIGGSIYSRKLRLVHETQKTNAPRDAQGFRFSFQAPAQRAIARKNEYCLRQVYLSKRLEKIARPFPRLQLGAK
jgi:hypothetical protein